ncbi:hypothetical protein JTE90_023650 [Oedothorax gibbosus]|uniref:Uncharacterized protein n=1 Tax=Oedothorax gibbosus TaxID=931172 RepID=A0AAV6UYW8_9ARAC|nr:hypothetical protein JTE90_023650 [Oedothorax gibbosus]
MENLEQGGLLSGWAVNNSNDDDNYEFFYNFIKNVDITNFPPGHSKLNISAEPHPFIDSYDNRPTSTPEYAPGSLARYLWEADNTMNNGRFFRSFKFSNLVLERLFRNSILLNDMPLLRKLLKMFQMPKEVGYEMMRVAARRINTIAIIMFWNFGYDVNRPEGFSTSIPSPLQIAEIYNHDRMLQFLISLGARRLERQDFTDEDFRACSIPRTGPLRHFYNENY